jgi:fibronectin-binding autotransporter adhesin
MNSTIGSRLNAVRSLAFVLAASLFAGCAGGSRVLPAGPLTADAGASAAQAGAEPSLKRTGGKRIKIRMEIRIPRRRREGERTRHPATISAMTRSVGIAVDGGTAHLFDTTAASPNCAIGVTGLTCTFSLDAAIGTDSFIVTTYSNTGGGGTALDSGVATVPIAKGKANAVAVRLGPVVTTTADTGIGSLRYAIATANAGDTIMFLLSSGSTIALASPIAIAGNVTLAGPGAAATVTIGGRNANQIFIVTGNATISGLNLAQGRAANASAPGGAIQNTGTLTLANDTIGTSTSVVALRHAPEHHTPAWRRHPHTCSAAFAEGGAVYNDGTLVMSGTTFNNNVVQSDVTNCITAQGGAIFNDTAGNLSSTGDTFTNNSALEGGAVYNMGVGDVMFTNDTFSANTGCTTKSGCTTNCTSMTCTSFAQGEGGAIFDAGAGVTIATSAFTSNVVGGATPGSQGQGGALVLNSVAPTVTGSTFTGNLAGGGTSSCSTGAGGAIAATASLVLNDDTFANNQAAGDSTGVGGAVLTSMDVQGTNDTFNSNVAAGSGSVCSTSPTGIGGGVFGNATVTLTNSTFSGNAATSSEQGAGGAIGCTSCYLTSDTFSQNSATGTGDAGATAAAGVGGAIYMMTVGKITGSSFSGNSAVADGPNATGALGGAIVTTTGTLLSARNVFTSNTVTEAEGTGTAAGGAIALASGTGVSNGDTFTTNGASGSNLAGGGAVYFDAPFVISGATFSGNQVSGGVEGVGGALILGGTGQLSNSTFAGNTATSPSGTGVGGAIYDTYGSTIDGAVISQNSASTEGGGIYAGAAGPETLTDSTVTANTVTAATIPSSGGGGIYALGGLSLAWSTVSNNSVTVGGAGKSGGGGIYNGGGMNLSQSTLSGNAVLGSAAGSGGGGIYNDAVSELINDTITGNNSALDGGGIEVASSDTATLSNVTLFKNTATGAGGNIDNPFTMSLANSIVAGGAAATGGDIDNLGTITSGDYNIIQTAVVGNTLSGATGNDKAIDPLLSALSNNGGPTFTNADQPGAAYIPFSSGSCGSVVNPIDQRGYARGGVGSACDAGAFEYGGVPTAARHHVGHKYSGPHNSHVVSRVRPLHVVVPKIRISW